MTADVIYEDLRAPASQRLFHPCEATSGTVPHTTQTCQPQRTGLGIPGCSDRIDQDDKGGALCDYILNKSTFNNQEPACLQFYL